MRLETKSCRILPLTYVTKYDSTYFPTWYNSFNWKLITVIENDPHWLQFDERINEWLNLIDFSWHFDWLIGIRFWTGRRKRSFNFRFSHSTFIHQFTPFSLHLTWFWHTLMTSTKFIFQHMEKKPPFNEFVHFRPVPGPRTRLTIPQIPFISLKWDLKNPWIGIENPWNRTENLWKGIRNPSTSPNISLHASESLKWDKTSLNWDRKSLKWDFKIPELGSKMPEMGSKIPPHAQTSLCMPQNP